MDELKKDIAVIRESQIKMEADVKYHIKRTDLNEEKLRKQLDPVYRAYSGAKWATGFIIGSSLLLGAITKIAGII